MKKKAAAARAPKVSDVAVGTSAEREAAPPAPLEFRPFRLDDPVDRVLAALEAASDAELEELDRVRLREQAEIAEERARREKLGKSDD
jgi:hypothetical protein